MRELQEQYEVEQYFSTLYKSQVSDLREEMDEKTKYTGNNLISISNPGLKFDSWNAADDSRFVKIT